MKNLNVEDLVLLQGNFILILNFLLVLIEIKQFNKFNQNIKWIWIWSCIALSLAIFELILIKFVFIGTPFFHTFIKPKLVYLGIVDYSFISSFSYLFKFIFLGLFFSNIFLSKQLRLLYRNLILVLVLFEIIMVVKFKSYQGYDSVSSTVKNLFILSSSGLFLVRFYQKDNSTLQLQKNPYFWIGLGLLIPALAEFFLEAVFSKLYQTERIGFYKLYLYRNTSQIIGFLLLIKGFSLAKYFKYLPEQY